MNSGKPIQAPDQNSTIGILGLGRLGNALLASLQHIGQPVFPRGRDARESLGDWAAACRCLCLTVQDRHIPQAVKDLSTFDLMGKTVLIHGAMAPLRLLDPLAAKGALTGKVHPLQSFSQKCANLIPPGTHFALQGKGATETHAWIKGWQGHIHQLKSGDWELYHLAAVMAANFLPLFIRQGARLLEPLAEGHQPALEWLAPLVQRSVTHALDTSQQTPFSGPASRGDWQTVKKHLSMLTHTQPQMHQLYQLASDAIRQATPTEKNTRGPGN